VFDFDSLGVDDFYGFLEVDAESNEKEIAKAYRKKALQCHPDKNPDNPAAGTLNVNCPRMPSDMARPLLIQLKNFANCHEYLKSYRTLLLRLAKDVVGTR
jgi:hypothetical protein